MHRLVEIVRRWPAVAAALAVAAVAGAGSITATSAVSSESGVPLVATLSGANEVPPANDPEAGGMARLRLNPGQESVCFDVSWHDVPGQVTVAHIHQGAPGVAGPHVVDLFQGSFPSTGSASGCVSAARSLIIAIIQNPSDYYVNIHSTVFPAGAARGQLAHPGDAETPPPPVGSQLTYQLTPPAGQPFNWGHIPDLASGLGSVWAAGGNQNAVGQITTPGDAPGDVNVIPVNDISNSRCVELGQPAGSYCADHIHALTVGPDGNLWFAVIHTGLPAPTRIIKMSPDGTILGDFPTPQSAATGNFTAVGNIVTGADGNLWYTSASNKAGLAPDKTTPVGYAAPEIVRITPDGDQTSFTLPAGEDIPCCSNGITAGPDGVYFPSIGVLNPSTDTDSYTESFINRMSYDGDLTGQWALPAGSQALRIIGAGRGARYGSPFVDEGSGRSGELWFNLCVTNCSTNNPSPPHVGHLVVRTGEVDIFPTTASSLTLADDGNLWVTEPTTTHSVVTLTPDGTVVATHPVGDAPDAITTGPDGNVYVGMSPVMLNGKPVAARVLEFVICGESNNYCSG